MRWRLWLTLTWSAPALALAPEVRDAVALGDCATVTRSLPAPRAPAERLAVGWCVRRDDPERAQALLTGLDDAALAPWGRWVAAEAQLTAGRPEAALADLDGVVLPGTPGLRVRLTRAKALLALGRSLEARPDLRALLATEVADEARVLLARGAEERGEAAPAIATYRRAWATSTRGPWADEAANALARLGAPVPDLATDEGRALAEERVVALRAAQRHAEALDLLVALQAARGERSAPEELGRAQFLARRYDAAVASWGASLGPPAEARGDAALMFDYALATSRTGDYAGAATIYRRLIAAHPSHPKADEASFKLGYLPYDEGRCAPAIEALSAHLARYPGSAFAESARWFLGRCQWREGDLAGAIRTWTELAERAPRSSLAPAALYWTARARGRLGDPERERRELEALLERHPTSGHAWFAAAALDHTFPARPIVPRPPWPAALAARPEVARAEALLDAGFRDWARHELAPIEAVARAAGREAALAAAHAFVEAGAYQTGISLARPYCVAPTERGDPVAQQACYPRPEAELVSRTAARRGLHPLLPYAIMLAESAMKPEVTSIAGARGLMQVMPAEGARLQAEALGHADDFDPDALYRAPFNALLGTTELGLKLQSLHGTVSPDALPAAIAAYNGGEAAVRRWLTAWEGPAPADEFAESIGYTETRRYVRTVLGNLMTWRWVYGDPAPVSEAGSTTAAP